MRLAAHATGGQYIFLTDHSGIGGPHAAPKVDQYKVETLNAAMTRMIRKELGSVKGGPRSRPVVPVAEEPALPVVATPVVAVVALVAVAPVPAAECPGGWENLKERLAAHLVFASSVALLVFAAMGVDAFIARRRRLLRRSLRG